ncbi:malto-oligosyltrehalose trehalohydrolase [Rhodococcus antarcticus]|uniref:Malto-oligosyltrehalose trehalohydrolase n=1 Tax=Rhodococcus antarcticus TaxID=2987751 RepID=A0ABY6NVT7_9NOCA|nr:malto-oligosyltrehalose trehalohydrolase [Rhodococcus antarcticus]UZJ23504.1 malto-oligosyltrehalose trehalohydrolase [Rhodococcus antarcticus]
MSHHFAVWAPTPSAVRVLVDGTAHPMSAAEDGWWHADVDAAGPGSRYGFLLDESTVPLPDPRSPRQPDGVHELSQVHELDPAAWTDQSWTGRPLAGSSVYELHVGTFTTEGTFDAAIARLDHLVDLGVDLVELMPVNGFNGTHNWGYDGVLWYTVHEGYGGPDGLQRFVDAAHGKGLGVLLDVVYNHLGPSGNYLERFGPYLSEAGGNTWGRSINLSGPSSGEVRSYVLENALGWMERFHVDGLRLDAVHALVDETATHLLEELAVRTESLSAHVGRPLTLIAESDLNDPRLVTPREAGGYGLTAQWCDDLHHAIHTAVTGERQGYYADFGSMETLATTLRRAYFHAGTWSSFRQRVHGRPIDPRVTPASRFLAYTSDHDQVGNRAVGDRPSAYLSPGLQAVQAALVLTSPYTPMLFMGEEWGASTPFQFFTSHPEPELGEATARGRKAEFAEHGWDADDVPDPQDPETFTRSKLDWSERDTGDHARMLEVYRALLALRRARPELTDPWLSATEVTVDEDARWIVLDRKGPGGGSVRIACNLSEVTVEVPITGDVLLAWGTPAVGATSTSLPGESFVVLAG